MSPKRNPLGGELPAFAALTIGAFVALGADQPFTSIGIALMGLGWCRWFLVGGRIGAPAIDSQLSQRCNWITSSTFFMITGSLGLWLHPPLMLPCVVMLLVGASTWCLVTGDDALVVSGETRQSWTSLLIVGGLSRSAALMLVVRVVQMVLSRESTSPATSSDLIESLMIASATSCVFGVTRLWISRKEDTTPRVLSSIVVVQTSIVLGVLAAMAWTLTRSESDHSPVFTTLGTALPMTLILWEALLIALYCCASAWSKIRRNRRTALISSLLLLDLAGIPPSPGFWLKWWSLENCLYPHHIESFAGMFDLHEGFRVLAIMLTGAQAAVSLRLLTTFVNQQMPVFVNSGTSPTDTGALSPPKASINHE